MRRLALALLLFVCAVALQSQDKKRPCRMDRTGLRFRNCDMGEPVPKYLFTWAPTSGECACAGQTWADGGTVTFARASAGWCRQVDAGYVSCATDEPRIEFGDTTVSGLGLRIERASTNYTLYNRDLSNAAWTKTNMTCAKDQTGVDKSANAASSCTASAANGTVTQQTCGATYGSSSAFVKRLVGTGTVEISCNGTTWVDITSSLSTSYKRFSAGYTDAIYPNDVRVAALSGASCINGASGGVYFRITTSGDSIAVDMTQCENLPYPTSPIATEGTAVARAAETATTAFTVTSTNKISTSAYSSTPYIVGSFNNTRGMTAHPSGYGSYLWHYISGAFPVCSLAWGSGTYTKQNSNSAFSGAAKKMRCYYEGATLFSCNDGNCDTLAAAMTTTGTTLNVDFGGFSTGDQVDGIVKQLCLSDLATGCP